MEDYSSYQRERFYNKTQSKSFPEANIPHRSTDPRFTTPGLVDRKRNLRKPELNPDRTCLRRRAEIDMTHEIEPSRRDGYYNTFEPKPKEFMDGRQSTPSPIRNMRERTTCEERERLQLNQKSDHVFSKRKSNSLWWDKGFSAAANNLYSNGRFEHVKPTSISECSWKGGPAGQRSWEESGSTYNKSESINTLRHGSTCKLAPQGEKYSKSGKVQKEGNREKISSIKDKKMKNRTKQKIDKKGGAKKEGSRAHKTLDSRRKTHKRKRVKTGDAVSFPKKKYKREREPSQNKVLQSDSEVEVINERQLVKTANTHTTQRTLYKSQEDLTETETESENDIDTVHVQKKGIKEQEGCSLADESCADLTGVLPDDSGSDNEFNCNQNTHMSFSSSQTEKQHTAWEGQIRNQNMKEQPSKPLNSHSRVNSSDEEEEDKSDTEECKKTPNSEVQVDIAGTERTGTENTMSQQVTEETITKKTAKQDSDDDDEANTDLFVHLNNDPVCQPTNAHVLENDSLRKSRVCEEDYYFEKLKMFLNCKSCGDTFNTNFFFDNYLTRLNKPILCPCHCVLCKSCYTQQQGCRAHFRYSIQAPVHELLDVLTSPPSGKFMQALRHYSNYSNECATDDKMIFNKELNLYLEAILSREDPPNLTVLTQSYEFALREENNGISFNDGAAGVLQRELAYRYVWLPHLSGFSNRVFVAGHCVPNADLIAPDHNLPKLFAVILDEFRFHWCCFVLKQQVVLAMWCTQEGADTVKVFSLHDYEITKLVTCKEFRSMVLTLFTWFKDRYVPEGKQLKVVLDTEFSNSEVTLVHVIALMANQSAVTDAAVSLYRKANSKPHTSDISLFTDGKDAAVKDSLVYVDLGKEYFLAKSERDFSSCILR